MGAMDEFKLKEGAILTKDYEGVEVVEGKMVRYVPLWEWLIGEGLMRW